MKGAKYKKILIPVLSVVLGLLVGALIMWVFGFDVVKGYSALLKGSLGKPFYIGETLRQATPLILVALGFAFASYAGFFNIGVAGQALVGWFASVATGLLLPDLPKIILLPLCIFMGMLAGAIWAGIAGYLKAYFNASEVIVTIMLNYTALHIVNFVIREVLTEKAEITASVPEAASLRMQFLYQLTGKSTLHGGIFIAILAVFIVWLIMNKTTTGFELKTVGLNKHAAEYAGMSAKKTIILARFIPFARTFAPFVAGAGSMHYRYFLSYNIIGGCLWIMSFVLLGYFFGNQPAIKNNFTYVIFGIIIFSILPVIFSFIKQKLNKAA